MNIGSTGGGLAYKTDSSLSGYMAEEAVRSVADVDCVRDGSCDDFPAITLIDRLHELTVTFSERAYART